ncbi:MAG: hypothetical protein ACK50A_06945, partial [Sphingobacteriaceae bacterium]
MKNLFKTLIVLILFLLNSISNVTAGNTQKNLLTNLWANYYESKFAPTPKKEQSNNEELKAKARDYLAAQP